MRLDLSYLLSGTWRVYSTMERANSRSVMLLNVLGNTRTTMAEATSLDIFILRPRVWGNMELCRAWDRGLQLFLFNEECLVGAVHHTAPDTSLPFVHTARRCYRLGD